MDGICVTKWEKEGENGLQRERESVWKGRMEALLVIKTNGIDYTAKLPANK